MSVEDPLDEAVNDIAMSITKTLTELEDKLCSKYGLTKQQLNFAVAKAGCVLAATRAQEALGFSDEWGSQLCLKIDRLISEESRTQ